MIGSTTCTWCFTVNDLAARWCKTCGHAALLSRDQCDCLKCAGLFSPASPTAPEPVSVHARHETDTNETER